MASHGQQTAELYGVALAVATAAVGRQSAPIFTGNQACADWFAGAKIRVNCQRSHFLAASMQALSSVDCAIKWIPGKLNPADKGSRMELNAAPPVIL